MPRHARLLGSSGMYHVMLRGINRQQLFYSDDDMCKMVYILSDCVEVAKPRIHAYCIMSNHVHLLLQTGTETVPDSETLAQVMKRIGSRYAIYYNHMNYRIGTAFQERYKSEIIGTDAYFIQVLRYIHRNPVKAGIVNTPDEYKWSSYHNYIGKTGFVYTNLGLDMLGGLFEAYMNEKDKITCIDDEPSKKITDIDLSAKIDNMLHVPASAILLMSGDERDKALREIARIKGVSYRQLSRVTGISTSIITHALN